MAEFLMGSDGRQNIIDITGVPEWTAEIAAIAQEKGITPNAAVYKAISLHLEKFEVSAVYMHTQRVTALENKLKLISTHLVT